ncbi:MAG: FeoB-associated Cys-rich membrane protein [Prevotella sp.]|nr:FeoB-associated Cys-rich membrane protein [Prevotella sp.]
MTFQHTIVLILLAAAVIYAAYRAWKAFHPADKENPACAGCQLKDNCKQKKVRNDGEIGTNCPGKMKN